MSSKFRTIFIWFSVICVNLLALEGISFVVLKISQSHLDKTQWKTRQDINARYGVDDRIIRVETNLLFERIPNYHPYRWFQLPRNFQGTYFHLDELGFRNLPNTLQSQTEKVAFFGGSTMFSVTTRDEGTIPYIFNKMLNQNLAQAVNYGMGAYNSTSELMTFIELSRLQKFKYAIFYDGVNEVGRYIEKVQDETKDPFYEVMGYPYFYAVKPALGNFMRGESRTEPPYMPYLFRVIRQTYLRYGYQFWSLFSRPVRTIQPNEIEESAETTAKIYEQNVLDISALSKAKGIVPVFFLQPNIYSSLDKKMSANEKYLASADMEKKLHILAYDKIRSKMKTHPEIKFFDISGILNNSQEEDVYFDYCHVHEKINVLLAEKIASDLKGVLPKNYWQ